jgi:hypothetical protein
MVGGQASTSVVAILLLLSCCRTVGLSKNGVVLREVVASMLLLGRKNDNPRHVRMMELLV